MTTPAASRDAAPKLTNVHVEKLLLGALLIDNDELAKVIDLLETADFADPVHAHIFDRVSYMVAAGMPASAATLRPYFEGDPGMRELGGVNYLAQLTADSNGLVATRALAEQIHELAARRWGIASLADLDQPFDAVASNISESAAQSQRGVTLPLADLSRWASTSPTPKPFVLAGRIPAQEVTLMTSVGGGAKSTFGHQACVCMAAGRQMLGINVQPGTAIYVTAEDDFDRLHWMHEHICRAVDVRQTDIIGRVHLSSVRGSNNNELAAFDQYGRIQSTPAFAMLRATLAATGAKFLVLDNVAHMFAGNESDRAQVTAFVNLLYSLCRDLGVTILLIAHPPKASAANLAAHAYSGSTAWQNAVRSHLVIEKPVGGVHDRVLRVEKANYAKPGEELRFVWHDFALWLESDIPDETRAEMDELIRANGENSAFMRCLAAATEARRAVSHNKGTNYFGSVFTAMPEGKGYKLKGFQAAFERLLHMGEIALDQQLWKRENRVWKYGIKAVEKRTDPPAPPPRTDPHQPPSETPGNTCTDLHAPTPLYTTYKGAGLEAPAPLEVEASCDDEPDYLAGWQSKSEQGL